MNSIDEQLYKLANHIILTGQEFRKLELDWKEYLILNQRNGNQPNQAQKKEKKKKKKKEKEREKEKDKDSPQNLYENSFQFKDDSIDQKPEISSSLKNKSLLERESDIYNQSYSVQSRILDGATSLSRNLAFDDSDDDDGRVATKRTASTQ